MLQEVANVGVGPLMGDGKPISDTAHSLKVERIRRIRLDLAPQAKYGHVDHIAHRIERIIPYVFGDLGVQGKCAALGTG